MRKKFLSFLTAFTVAFFTVGMPITVSSADGDDEYIQENGEHSHNLIENEAAEPECTKSGLDRYWICSECGRMFSDNGGISEITSVPVIPPLGHSYADGVCTLCGAECPWIFDEVSGALTILSDEGTSEWYRQVDEKAVKSIDIKEGVTCIEDYAFMGCTSVTAVAIPAGVTYLGWYAFYGCSSLETVSLPEGINEIGYAAFNYCINLRSLIIPSSLRTVTYPIFDYCENLEAVGYYAPLQFMLAPTITAKYSYADDGNGGWTVRIVNNGGRTSISIPDEIEGKTVSKIINYSTSVIIHNHRGGNATCIEPADCSVCGQEYGELTEHTEDDGTITKQPTESETGIKTFNCIICGIELRTESVDKLPPKHIHSYSTEWKSDSNSHWHECVCGEKVDFAEHISDDGTITKQPSETETGIKTFTCTICGNELRAETIEALTPEHFHVYCTEWKSDSNSHWHECVCGEKADMEVHISDGGTVTKKPTETETGELTYFCRTCGYKIYSEIIPSIDIFIYPPEYIPPVGVIQSQRDAEPYISDDISAGAGTYEKGEAFEHINYALILVFTSLLNITAMLIESKFKKL